MYICLPYITFRLKKTKARSLKIAIKKSHPNDQTDQHDQTCIFHLQTQTDKVGQRKYLSLFVMFTLHST